MVNERARGQLILIGAIIVAMVILSSVVLLNSIHFSEDVKTGKVSDDAATAEELNQQLRRVLETLFLHRSSHPDTFYGTGEPLPYALETELAIPNSVENRSFVREVNQTGAVTRNLTAARTGAVVDVTLDKDRSVYGNVTYQNDKTAKVLNASGAANWTVADDVTTVPRLQFEFSDPATGDGADNFVLNVSNGTHEWHLEVLGNNVIITHANGSSTSLCGGFNGRLLSLDATPGPNQGVVDAVNYPCARHFTIGGSIEPPYTLSVHNGDNVEASYVMTHDAEPEEGPNTIDESGDVLLINPAFQVTYMSSGVEYETNFSLYNRTNR